MSAQQDGGDDRRPSRRVADELRTAIEAGEFPVGAALPPLRLLAERHGVAVNTAMAAVRLLEDEGYVTTRPNAGSYVRDRASKVEPEQELRRLRVELGELRGQVRQVGAQLAAIDDRLSALSEVVVQLEDLSRHTGL
jgi:DNA-binding GntR family transcriptional regulator